MSDDAGNLEKSKELAIRRHEVDGAAPVIASELGEDFGNSILPFPIVAIGASAGGLEAYVELLSTLAPDTGMAFVLVSHLSPEHESHLAEILGRRANMPVHEIQDNVAPEPNNVYVIPRGTRLLILNGRFVLEPRARLERAAMPIDYFFRSLAAHQKNKAIGVVLSGMDSDGALGLNAIKGEGGISIVQTPESALFEQMPRSGIASDHVDLILPPAQIGVELARLAKLFNNPALIPLEEGSLPPNEAAVFNGIFALLKSVSGIDFRLYKQTTIRRRIARRMLVNRIEALADYWQFLQSEPEEVGLLQEDLLINVTRFFRDPETFDAIKFELFTKLFSERVRDQPIRIWAAGCASGEEVYSLAICLVEHLGTHQIEPTIHIFGTDVSESSVEKARKGIYPEAISAELSPERLRRFFSKVDGGYQISKRIRDLCIFARQNLCNDPPFSRLDLISCRNVLIYLGASAQKRIMQTFNYALRPDGYLVLGSSESIRDHSELFLPVDRKNKFYRRVDGPVIAIEMGVPSFAPDLMRLQPPPGRSSGQEAWNDVELQRAADRIVLTRYGPAGVVVNAALDVLQFRGHTAPYLEHSPGAPHFNLLRMARNDLAPALREAAQRAISESVAVKKEAVRIRTSDALLYVNIEVLPIHNGPSRAPCYLVLFLPAEPPLLTERINPLGIQAPVPDEQAQSEVVAALREDLDTTRSYLQSLIEEQDNRNQELTSAYEEIQSSNEELQSTNEELETAKEELQSTNEELQVVNEELRNRNSELLQASNDLVNLLNSVNIPVLILDNNLTIRHFTPPSERFMHVRASDIGRRIGEIRLNLLEGDIEPMLQEVLDTLGTKEVEVQDRQGRWHILRARPYRTAENKIEGLVLVLVDIDQIRRSERALREARDMAQAVIERVTLPLVVLNNDLQVVVANAAFRELSGVGQQSLELHSFPDLISLVWNLGGVAESLRNLVTDGVGFDEEHSLNTKEPRAFHISGLAVSFDGVRAVLVTMEDITARKQADRVLEQEQQRLESEVREAREQLERTQGELRGLTGMLFTTQEAERKRVARELHDDVGQRLAMLANEAEQLSQRLPGSPEETRRLESVRQQAADLSEDIRRISHALHPSILEDLGLPSALRSMVSEFEEREMMPADFTHRRVPANLPNEIVSTLYRITQEALRNVSKHAGRTHVRVSLTGNKADLRLLIRDMGEGFDPSESRGLGLISMEERARLIGASFSIASSIGEGTVVEVRVPLDLAKLETEGLVE